jgi:hypothetical protein
MSATNESEDNWILIQSRYDYIALPVELATQVLRRMRVVTKNNGKIELANEGAQIHVISNEQMQVALVKARMLPKEDENGK